MAGRLFNEKEVGEILKRASSLRSGGGLGDPGGISLQELQQTAAELGFDPADIERAAQQVGTMASPNSKFFSPRIVLDRTVEGEVTDDDWMGMVAVIQRYHKASGAVTQRAGNYDWTGSEEGGSLALTVNVRNGKSRIRLESNRWTGIMVSSVVCLTLAIVFSAKFANHGNPAAGLLVFGIAAAFLYNLQRYLHQNHADSVHGLLSRLIDEVHAESATQTIVDPTHQVGQTETQERSVQA